MSRERMPTVYLGHGAPPLVDDPIWPGELAAWAAALPRPKAILVISAHWENAPLTIGATTPVPLVYDFSGFPEKYYRVTYPAPGAPALARRVRQLVGAQTPVADEPARGLDHGAYVPLTVMYPHADVPVLQISMPSLDASQLLTLGRQLAPLRDEGVLIMGSGFLTHGLPFLTDFRPDAPPPGWSKEFDAWAAETLARGDVDALVDYRRSAPGLPYAHPTVDHFVPLFVALGASLDETPRTVIDGYGPRARTARWCERAIGRGARRNGGDGVLHAQRGRHVHERLEDLVRPDDAHERPAGPRPLHQDGHAAHEPVPQGRARAHEDQRHRPRERRLHADALREGDDPRHDEGRDVRCPGQARRRESHRDGDREPHVEVRRLRHDGAVGAVPRRQPRRRDQGGRRPRRDRQRLGPAKWTPTTPRSGGSSAVARCSRSSAARAPLSSPPARRPQASPRRRQRGRPQRRPSARPPRRWPRPPRFPRASSAPPSPKGPTSSTRS